MSVLAVTVLMSCLWSSVSSVVPRTIDRHQISLSRTGLLAADTWNIATHSLWTRSLLTTVHCRLIVEVRIITSEDPPHLSLSPCQCWTLSVVLVNVPLSCLDVIYVTDCEVVLSPPPQCPTSSASYRGSARSISANPAPPAGPGRRALVGEGARGKFLLREPPVL